MSESTSDAHTPAGMTFAPAYDVSQELDPSRVEAAPPPQADIQKLEYFEHLHARSTFMARAALLTIIFGVLAANAWLSQRNYDALLINMDQARIAQADIDERNSAQIDLLQQEVRALRSELSQLRHEASVGLLASR